MFDLNLTSACAVLLPFAGSLVGQAMTRKSLKTWYQHLRKPWFNPPDYAFPIAWTYLYGTMGYASYLVYRDGGGFDGPARYPLTLYAAKMAVNWAFTPIFFGAKKLGLALIDTAALWVLVGATGNAFFQINQNAGVLFLPYLAWCSLAVSLSYFIWRDNPEQGGKSQ